MVYSLLSTCETTSISSAYYIYINISNFMYMIALKSRPGGNILIIKRG